MEKNLFSKKECDNIIEYGISLNKWRRLDSNIYHYYISDLVINKTQEDKIKNYCKKHLNIELTNVDVALFKYEVGDYIKPHIDRFLNKDGTHTKMVYNINMILNNDYSGGDFYLDGKLYNQDIGTVYHYSSDTFHEVKIITEGVRYSTLFYIKEQYIKTKMSII